MENTMKVDRQGIRHPKPSHKQAAAELQSSEGTLNTWYSAGERTEGPVSDEVWMNILPWYV